MKRLNPNYKKTIERQDKIREKKASGLTLRAIAKEFNISYERVRQVLGETYSEYYDILNLNPIAGIENIPVIENISRYTGIKSGSRDRIREIVRIRDNHTCQFCGKVWENGRRFDIHHLDCDRDKTKACDKREEIPDMITWCHSCHLKYHYKLNPWNYVR